MESMRDELDLASIPSCFWANAHILDVKKPAPRGEEQLPGRLLMAMEPEARARAIRWATQYPADWYAQKVLKLSW